MTKIIATVLILILLTAHLPAGRALTSNGNITKQCQFWVSEGRPNPITDEKITTKWHPRRKNAEVRVTLPEGGAGCMQVQYLLAPTGYVLTQYDAALNPIATHTQDDDEFPCIASVYDLEENAAYVSLKLTQPGQCVNRISVFAKETDNPLLARWEAPYEKCDLMVISAHQDDEWVFFGGIIPYYQRVSGKSVQVVYMAECSRLRYSEALNGLWASGSTHYPIFIGLKDERIGSFKKTVADWGGPDKVIETLVEVIRRRKPEVIVTHDRNGEYGHNQHRATSRAMQLAIEAAADPNRYPDSAAVYGAWQVKKLYRHLSNHQTINFDWNRPYDQLDGMTPLAVARRAYEEHPSQHSRYQVDDGGKYDNSKFGLDYSVVGDDIRHDDLFENIP